MTLNRNLIEKATYGDLDAIKDIVSMCQPKKLFF